MQRDQLSRRHFMQSAAALTAGTLLLGPSRLLRAADPVKRSATDIVTLGKTGIKLSRLGIGTGVNNGMDNLQPGRAEFIKVLRHAMDQGITYIDCAQRYQTFDAIKEAIAGVPREKLFIQTKIWPGDVRDVMAGIDAHRKNFNTDYIDSMLIHCRTDAKWTDIDKAYMDAYTQAQEKKWIRAKGVSCHSKEALDQAAKVDWADTHLVRVNPQGIVIDGPNGGWPNTVPNPVQPVVDQIKIMHDKGRGVIGMKIFGNGFIKDPAEQEKSVRFAMSNPNIDAIVIGMTSTQQIDQNIKLINKVLAELPAPA
jgi:predicted aldo/keto reductase-like oxidoreductase